MEGDHRVALWDFDGDVDKQQLSFREGDIVLLLDAEGAPPGWAKGQLNGSSGFFPLNYTEPGEENVPEPQVNESISNDNLEIPYVAVPLDPLLGPLDLPPPDFPPVPEPEPTSSIENNLTNPLEEPGPPVDASPKIITAPTDRPKPPTGAILNNKPTISVGPNRPNPSNPNVQHGNAPVPGRLNPNRFSQGQPNQTNAGKPGGFARPGGNSTGPPRGGQGPARPVNSTGGITRPTGPPRGGAGPVRPPINTGAQGRPPQNNGPFVNLRPTGGPNPIRPVGSGNVSKPLVGSSKSNPAEDREDKEKKAREELEQQTRLENERKEQDKIEREKQEREQQEREQQERAQLMEQEKQEQERQERDSKEESEPVRDAGEIDPRQETDLGPDGTRPPRTSQAEVLCTVRALYPYEGNSGHKNILSFDEGELIDVIVKNPNGWWTGRIRGVLGYFPSNFVEDALEGEEYENKNETTERIEQEPETVSHSSSALQTQASNSNAVHNHPPRKSSNAAPAKSSPEENGEKKKGFKKLLGAKKRLSTLTKGLPAKDSKDKDG